MDTKSKKIKVCLISSSGGHFEQLLMLRELENHYEVYYVTEDTKYRSSYDRYYYVKQINRHEKTFVFKFIYVFIQSLVIYVKERPDVIISTGALCVIPTFIIGKIFHKKLIFIESFAKISTPTLTGKFIYKIADRFFIQWEELELVYPRAEFLGSIY